MGLALQRGLAAHRAGDLDAAALEYHEVLAQSPHDENALQLLGHVAFARREFHEAEAHFLQVLVHTPGDTVARFNLGKTYEVLGRTDEAEQTYALIPPGSAHYLDARMRVGIIQYAERRMDAAAATFEGVLREGPTPSLLAAVNLGIVYNHLGRFEEGVKLLGAVLEADPKNGDARRALADSFRFLGLLDAAIAECHLLLDEDPNDVAATIIIGRALYDRGAFSDAELAFARAADLAPERHEPRTNLNVFYHGFGRLDEAIDHGEAAIALAPTDVEAHVNLAVSKLMAGDFSRGWPLFEWRLRETKQAEAYPYRGRLARWDGLPFSGTLLVARDQGAGDFILLSRFFPQLRSRVGSLTVECPPELASLYAGFPGIDTLIGGFSELARAAQFDAHIPIGSVPGALEIDAHHVAASRSYLSADPERCAAFAERFAHRGVGRKIGIVWGGSPLHGSDRYRSCGLAAFAPLAHLPGIIWISLQKGPREEEAREAPAGMDLLALGPEIRDFSDTAAAISALDLIITVDTSVAHLAGALGKPVWTLLGFETYWLWGAQRADTPWYPTMRLFRQHVPDDWTDLFGDVREALIDR